MGNSTEDFRNTMSTSRKGQRCRRLIAASHQWRSSAMLLLIPESIALMVNATLCLVANLREIVSKFTMKKIVWFRKRCREKHRSSEYHQNFLQYVCTLLLLSNRMTRRILEGNSQIYSRFSSNYFFWKRKLRIMLPRNKSSNNTQFEILWICETGAWSILNLSIIMYKKRCRFRFGFVFITLSIT